MLTLFYSPHATSVDNEAGRASGHADVPLSQRGLQKAGELGQHYTTQTLDAVFCSDLQRAVRTAEIAFAERKLPCARDARLRECDYGDLTQCPVAQIDEEFPQRILEPFPHGQSVRMAVDALGTFLQDVLQAYDGKTIVVIGHRVTRYGLEYWCGDSSLETIVRTPWQWRDIPIWHYELHARDIERRSIVGSHFEDSSDV
ncbi:histidine phosphatase family protein [Ktedonobacteria bacterium brp13]|nr:histidine phosphatase family protein [Ktedonobacteria bacterium brp13]